MRTVGEKQLIPGAEVIGAHKAASADYPEWMLPRTFDGIIVTVGFVD